MAWRSDIKVTMHLAMSVWLSLGAQAVLDTIPKHSYGTLPSAHESNGNNASCNWNGYADISLTYLDGEFCLSSTWSNILASQKRWGSSTCYYWANITDMYRVPSGSLACCIGCYSSTPAGSPPAGSIGSSTGGSTEQIDVKLLRGTKVSVKIVEPPPFQQPTPPPPIFRSPPGAKLAARVVVEIVTAVVVPLGLILISLCLGFCLCCSKESVKDNVEDTKGGKEDEEPVLV